jgi:hypothetical protein
MSATTDPLFDSSRSALHFALSSTRTRYAAPLMSKMMSEIKLAEKPLKLKRRRNKETGEWIITQAQEPAVTRAHRPGGSLRGLDAAGQAGMILLHFSKLSSVERACLACSVVHPRVPCSCKSACCRGWTPNGEFADGLETIEWWLGTQLRKRILEQKALHRTLVEHHFGVGLKTLRAIGAIHDITPQTVIVHRDIIIPLLTEAEKSGWSYLDQLLTEAGIVGALQT